MASVRVSLRPYPTYDLESFEYQEPANVEVFEGDETSFPLDHGVDYRVRVIVGGAVLTFTTEDRDQVRVLAEQFGYVWPVEIA